MKISLVSSVFKLMYQYIYLIKMEFHFFVFFFFSFFVSPYFMVQLSYNGKFNFFST